MKTKAAKTTYPIHPVLRDRWSPRAFNGATVPETMLQSLFEAARWAPSSSNEQPWRFVVGQKGDATYDTIFERLVEFNQLWAATAPVLVVAIAKTTSSKNAGKENKAAIYDLGQAIAFLTFQAAADGLYVHQMGGFDAKALGNALHVPEDYQVQTVSAIGYIGDPEQLHPNLKAMEFNERERQPLRDMVFGKSFGETADFI